MTGSLTLTSGGNIFINQASATSLQYIRFHAGDNDYGRIAMGATANNAGYLEIATADDGTEPIYIRQYNNGIFGNIVRTGTLLDASGNTQFPGTVQANYFTCRNTTLCTNLNAQYLAGQPICGKGGAYGVTMSWRRGSFTTVNQYFGNGNVVTLDPTPTDAGGQLSPNTTILSLGDANTRNTQLAFLYDNDVIKYRRCYDGPTWTSWVTLLHTGNYAATLDGRYVNVTGDTMSGKLTVTPYVEVLSNTADVNAMLVLHNANRVWGNITMRDDVMFHFTDTNSNTSSTYIPLKAYNYIATSTALCTNLNADQLDGYNENSFLRYRGATATAGDNTLWAQIGIKEYHNAYPDGLSNGIYDYGAVVSLPSSNARLDIWYNHQSSGQANNGIQYRTGWGTDKKPWRMILDSVNYYNYTDGRYVNVTGDTMTGALNFANGIRNSVGDDCGFGDGNVGGCTCFQGTNGDTGIALIQKGAAWSGGNHYRFTWNGSNMTSSSTAQWNNLNADLLDGLHNTSFLRTGGQNQLVTLTGGNGNTSGWRLVMDAGPMGGWTINSMTLLVSSRHQGTGIISLVFHTTNADGTTYAGDVRYYGSLTSISQSTWRAFYNTSTKKLKLFWYFYDYSDCYVSILNCRGYTTNITNGTWYTSLPSDRGTELSTYYNAAQYAHQLYTARTINGTSFNGTANITTSYWGTTRTFYTNSHDGYQNSAGINVNGSANVILYLPPSIRCSSWFRSTGATGWYNDTYGGGIYMIDSIWIRTYNNKKFHVSNSDVDAINTAGGVYSTRNTYGAASASHFLNFNNSVFNQPNMAVAHNNDRPILTWSDTVTNYGYVTRYSIGSFRPTNGAWGRMRLAVGNNDAGTSYGCVMDISGNGYVEVSGSVYATGAMTAKSSSSDIRLKRDIKDFSAMDILRKIQPKQFYWNEIAKANSPALNNDYRQYGLIAQSIQNMPELEGFVDNVFKDYLIIHYEKFIPIALEGLREVDDEVTKLKREVATLRQRIATLEGKSLSA